MEGIVHLLDLLSAMHVSTTESSLAFITMLCMDMGSMLFREYLKSQNGRSIPVDVYQFIGVQSDPLGVFP